MKKHKLILVLGLICISAFFLQTLTLGVLPFISVLVPYLTFCVCSLLICKNKIIKADVLKIILIGLLGLPIFDLFYPMLTTPLLYEIYSATAIVFVQICIYFTAFVLCFMWINKTKKVLKPGNILLILLLALVYSIINGAHAILVNNSFQLLTKQGSIIEWLTAIGNYKFLSNISNITFYLNIFYTSIQLYKKH